jgi:hypothetical protein
VVDFEAGADLEERHEHGQIGIEDEATRALCDVDLRRSSILLSSGPAVDC